MENNNNGYVPDETKKENLNTQENSEQLNTVIEETQVKIELKNDNSEAVSVEDEVKKDEPLSIEDEVRKDNSNELKHVSFYTENYTKQKTKQAGTLKIGVVAACSAILGGIIVAFAFLFISPLMQNNVSKVLGDPKSSTKATSNMPVKKIDITGTADSPASAVAEKVSPSIVGIRVTYKTSGFFNSDQEAVGEGSGIIISKEGLIITNNHVIESAASSKNSKIIVILPNQKDKPYEAEIKGRDSKTDLALIKINGENLPAAEYGDSDKLAVGETVIAIGNPGGLEYMGSVTTGVVSGLNRTIPIADNKQLKLIQTDAAINPGNSGGALCNTKGQIIGVNTAKIEKTGYEGLGFAIPINKVKEIASSLENFKYVKGRPQIGITIEDQYTEEYAKANNYPAGIMVKSVAMLSGAYKAGIKIGDVITKFDGKEVKTYSELEELKNQHKPGEKVKITVIRDDNKTIELDLELTEYKEQN